MTTAALVHLTWSTAIDRIGFRPISPFPTNAGVKPKEIARLVKVKVSTVYANTTNPDKKAA